MSDTLSVEDVAAGDALAEQLEASWGWYLAGGIIAILFGFLIMTWRHETLHAFSIFVGIMFLFVGLMRLVDVFFVPARRVTSAIVAVILIGVGIAVLVWPSITYFVITVLLAWSFLVWGVVEVIAAFAYHRAPYWWVHLIGGLISLLIGIWVLRNPNHALSLLVILIGVWIVIFGVVEIMTALAARHAKETWSSYKTQLGV
jgi:uncharacterized membrane protein HdeD (DUF308 family)